MLGGALVPKGESLAPKFSFANPYTWRMTDMASRCVVGPPLLTWEPKGGDLLPSWGRRGWCSPRLDSMKADGKEGWFGVGGVWVVSVVAEDGGDEAGSLVGVVGVVGFEGRGYVEAAGGGHGDLEADVVW